MFEQIVSMQRSIHAALRFLQHEGLVVGLTNLRQLSFATAKRPGKFGASQKQHLARHTASEPGGCFFRPEPGGGLGAVGAQDPLQFRHRVLVFRRNSLA